MYERNPSRIDATAMKILKKIEGKTRRDHMRNAIIRPLLNMELIKDKSVCGPMELARYRNVYIDGQ